MTFEQANELKKVTRRALFRLAETLSEIADDFLSVFAEIDSTKAVKTVQTELVEADSKAILTKKDLAKMFKVSERTINEWQNEGMPFIKKGKVIRFEREKVLLWANRKNEKSRLRVVK